MPRKDISVIADELWWICKEYDGIPSQTVDRKAYSKAKYYLKTYSDRPEIKSVIKEFNLTLPRTYTKIDSGHPLSLEEVKMTLEERGRMPRIPEELQLYHKVNYFFKKNCDNEEVKRLEMIYGYFCPLYERGGIVRYSGRGRAATIKRVQISMEYVLETYKKYKEFPAINTIPMKFVRVLLERPWKFLPSQYYTMFVISENEFTFFLKELIDLGCNDEMVIYNWNNKDKWYLDKRE